MIIELIMDLTMAAAIIVLLDAWIQFTGWDIDL